MPLASDVTAYYRAALLALQYLEHRRPTGRRFGAEADARWAAFRGDLTASDRIDLLIRDADAEWPGALGPRSAFAMNDVAEDDPFGSRWTPLDGVDAEDMWRESMRAGPPSSLAALLEVFAPSWQTLPAPERVDFTTPTERFVLAGANAIASAIAAFTANADLDWTRQVVVVATPPTARQLAALATALLNINAPSRILAANAAAPDVAGYTPAHSLDALDRDAAWAAALARAN